MTLESWTVKIEKGEERWKVKNRKHVRVTEWQNLLPEIYVSAIFQVQVSYDEDFILKIVKINFNSTKWAILANINLLTL